MRNSLRFLAIAVSLLVMWAGLGGMGLQREAWGQVGGGAGVEGGVRYPAVGGTLKPADFGAEALLVVHYHRFDGKYEPWNLWGWGVEGAGNAMVQEGKGYAFTGKTGYGMYAVVPFTKKPERAGIIVRKGNWEQKDIDRDRFVSFGPSAVAEVWLVSGDDTLYTDPSKVDFSVKPIAAFLDAPNRITFAATGMLSGEQTALLKLSAREGAVGAVVPGIASVEQVETPGTTKLIYEVTLSGPVGAADLSNLVLTMDGFKPLTVFARDVLSEPMYSPMDAALGYVYSAEGTTFTTWSPVSTAVELLLYPDTNATKPERVIPLVAGEKGLWKVRVEGDLNGRPYRYRFTSYGVGREVPDIHTQAANYNSKFSMVVDLSKLVPPGWGTVAQPKLAQPTDEIIYEIHVRDFSIADESMPVEKRGTYLGLIHENPGSAGKPSTGLSHLKDLGVTAVHLLPIQDFTAEVGEYNWGYWTALFNVPEANYSTTPRDPGSAVTQLRTAIQGLHRAGIRVILDVVYNHTSSSGEYSPFDQTVPYYYFRTTPDGRMRNDAGVGNSMADERPMVRKYILDSLEYWMENYRVDGFRFDLLGTHQPETVRAIEARVVPIRSDVTLYGEPWTGGGPTYFGKGSQKGLRMAVFNDHFRNALRGDLDGTTPGFATGPGGDVPAVRNGLAGSIDDFAEDPTETVNYVSAHDNRILWDKLVATNPGASDEELRRMQKFSQGIILLSQGIAFLHGGCDFARTKGGNHNSYNAGDEVNKFDWARKAQYMDVHNYLRGLIAIRKAYPAFRLTTREQVRSEMKFVDPQPEGVIMFTLEGTGDSGEKLLVVLNGGANEVEVGLPEGKWEVIADGEKAGVVGIGSVEGKVGVPGYSVVVGRR